MEVKIRKTPGEANDLLAVIPRGEIEEVLLSIPERDKLMQQAGLPRHRDRKAGEKEKNAACKVPMDEHLKRLSVLDERGVPRRRVMAIGNRNLGNNHGFVAWQNDKRPKFFHIREDPLNYPSYSCLVSDYENRLSIRDIRCANQHVSCADDGTDMADQIRWATFGQCVLRAGIVVNIEDIIDQFYDIRHILAYDTNRPEGKEIAEGIFEEYPNGFREQALRALNELGVPRNRYLHNALGLSKENVYILQREGTPEEIAGWLRDAGAEDGIILDNGGSVACWAWWPGPKGDFIFAAPDYRPPSSSILAFVLKGPVHTKLPGGSVAYAIT